MHRLSEPGRIQMIKAKFSSHIVEKNVLNNQNKMLVHLFKSLNFVVELKEDGLSGHLPIHAESLFGCNRAFIDG